jgi:hypothetical protein
VRRPLWHIAIFFCNAKFGGYRGIADIDQAAPIQHPILRAKHAIRRPPERRFESIQTTSVIGEKLLLFRNCP